MGCLPKERQGSKQPQGRTPLMAVGIKPVLLALVLMLAGCGGAESSSELHPGIFSSDSSNTSSVQGQAAKGILQHALVKLYLYQDDQWVEVASTLTDEAGLYEMDTTGFSGPARLVVQADPLGHSRMQCDSYYGCGPSNLDTGDTNDNGVFDFGEYMPMPEDFTLSALLMLSEQGEIVQSISPFTSMAAEWTQTFPEGVTEQSILLSNQRLAQVMGLPEDYASQLALDLNDTQALESASQSQLHYTLMLASMASQAQGGDWGATLQAFADTFAEFGGQMPVTHEEIPHMESIYRILDLLLDENLVVQQDNIAEDLRTHFQQFWADIEAKSTTLANTTFEYDQENLDRAMIALTDMHHYLDMAGINGSATFITNEVHQLNWLYTDEMASMVQLAIESLISTIMVATIGDQLVLIYGSPIIDLSSSEQYSLVYNSINRTLTFSGLYLGQDVSMVIDLTSLLAGAYAGELSYRVVGQVSNATATGNLDMKLDFDLYDMDLVPLVVALQGSMMGNEQSAPALLAEIEALIPDLHARVTLDGNGSLASSTNPDWGFSGDLLAWGEVNVPGYVDNGEDLLSLDIQSGSFVSPEGDTVFSREGESVLYASIGGSAYMSGSFGVHAFGMPVMYFDGQGEIDGVDDLTAQTLLDIETMLKQDGITVDALFQLFQGIDLSLLKVEGEGHIDVPSDDKFYTLRLEGNQLEVSLPNSIDPSFTFHLQGLHGGFIYSGNQLVGTVTFNWAKTGMTIYLADGRQASFLLGPIVDALPEQFVAWLTGIGFL